MQAKDLKDKTFKSKLSGYDKEEVNAFIREAYHSMEELEAANQYLQQQLYQANQRIEEFSQKEQTLNRSIVVAQEAADRLREESLTEADTIVEKAEEEGQRVLKQAAKRALMITNEREKLKAEAEKFVMKMIALTQEAQEMLTSSNWTDVFRQEEVKAIQMPTLEQVIKELDLPIKQGEAEEFYNQEAEKLDKQKQTEAFFEENEKLKESKKNE